MTFVLTIKDDSRENISQWFSDTTKITKQEGLRWTTACFEHNGTASLYYECTEEEYERFKSKYNLIDYEIDRIIFLKGDYIHEIS